MTNNALLIIDVQKGFINEYTRELPGKIEKLQNNYANVYAMQFINLEDSMFRKQLNWHKLSLNTQDTELAFKIRPDALVFSKYSYGATPEFIEYLQQQGITSIMQMATQEGANVAVYAVRGNFDDAQTGVKKVFGDKAIAAKLAERNIRLSSANSINWGRLVPQIVYYLSLIHI